jgi:glycosyltransferase involved in cell wall biosynthesis
MQGVHNGINFTKFNPSNPYKNIRAELGIDSQKVVVLFLARFTAHKQPLTLLKAFFMAMKKDETLHLLMVGDGDEKAQALQMITAAQAADRITLLPFRADVPDILAAADVYVLPSLWEGFPIGLLEAMAMGRAIIASDVDGNNDVMMHKENGLLVSPTNLENDLEKSILSLAADREPRQKLGEMARYTVVNRFDEETMTREIEAIYRSTLVLQYEQHATT